MHTITSEASLAAALALLAPFLAGGKVDVCIEIRLTTSPVDEQPGSLLALVDQALNARPAGDLQAGWFRLSPREREVIALVLVGKTSRAIAAALFISAETVNTHVYKALGKMGLRKRAELRHVLLTAGLPLALTTGE